MNGPEPIKVLFVCIHNSARSQMAEAFLNALGGGRFEAESAGLEPGRLNPLAVEAMRDVGIDIAGRPTKSVFDLLKRDRRYDYVITVCDETAAERCPLFPGAARRLHWSFADPGRFEGSPAARLAKTIEVRDLIRRQIDAFTRSVPKA
jgi:arsenate reductase